MFESSTDAADERRESKRGTVRLGLSNFKTPTAIRKISATIDKNAGQIEGRLRAISKSSDENTGDDTSRVSSYIEERAALIDEMQSHLNDVRKATMQAQEKATREERSELKRALKDLDDNDRIILRERATLASSRVRIDYGMRGQLSHVKLGEAYMMSLTKNFPAPAGRFYDNKSQRTGNEQLSFRNRLIKTYQFEGSRLLETCDEEAGPELWCPVSGRAHHKRLIRTAHIVPPMVGEVNVSYLFGVKPSEGFGIICVILCEQLLEKVCGATETTYRTSIHNKRLQFQTAARPSKRYLYIHALLTMFRRRRYNVSGWENDRDQIFSDRTWATPGKWARRSMVEALAVEFGDTWEEHTAATDALGNYPDIQPSEDEKKMATVVRYAFESRGKTMVEVEEEEEEEEEQYDDDDY
ncbi:hypothetical protein LTS17_007919 [Exophiala oligosperma]